MKRILATLLILCAFANVGLHAQNIIPFPNHYHADGDQLNFYLTDDATIGYTDNSLKDAAEYLGTVLRPSTGFRLKTQKSVGTITLELSKPMKAGSYSLEVLNEGIVISGADYRGVIAGIQTLRQLFPAEIESRQQVKGAEWKVPCCEIEDAPRYGYRGLELDVSRHFFTKQEVMNMLDVMALYKLNKLHWHLTDDQGWRIEIKKYPKLTQNGAWRKYNNHDRICLNAAKTTDNDDMLVPTDRYKVVKGDTLYGGFYTQKDIREIVEYARVRGIDIIPEVDMPGHILAALQNYDGISCFKETGWGKVFSSPACPGKDSAIEFCKNVYAEVMQLFPYEYIHIGGDEVDKTNWKKCDDCQKRMRDHGLKTEEELQSWFIHEMEKFINSKGKKMIGWNEIIEGGLSDTSTIMWWGSWVKDVPQVTTSHGNDLIYTPNDLFYLDYAESAESMKNIYNFNPDADLTAEQQKHVLGVQGNIWCEQIPTYNRMWYMTATRMLAIAELGWSAPTLKNYFAFEDRVINQLPRLREKGVKYRLLDIEGFNATNAFVGKGRYHVTCKDPDVTIRYTTDGTFPNENSTLLKGDLVLDKTTDVTFRSFRADGSKGDMVKARFVADTYSPAVQFIPTANGLKTEWHEFPGIDCNKIIDAPLNQTYFTPDVCIPEGVSGNIGLITTGYIYIPQDGIYTFTLTSDDGSDLFIDDNLLVDMNREQSPVTTIGEKALRKGYHAIRVRYFDHNGGLLRLVVNDEKGKVMKAEELFYY